MGKSCMECGAAILEPSKRKSGQVRKFCSDGCRKRFNNRRATRGAELYDYWMSAQYQRKTHRPGISVMSQMSNGWRDADLAERDGRRSWMTPDLSLDPVTK